MDRQPLYHIGQVLCVTHSWAVDWPTRPVKSVAWDESWQCFTYGFPLCLIRIEEERVKPTGNPDLTTDEWLAAYRAQPAGRE